MKSALKKVLSLMLVAMLLVTAIPFQVSAAEGQYMLIVKFVDIDSGAVVHTQEGEWQDTVPTFSDSDAQWWIENESSMSGYSFVSMSNNDGTASDGTVTYVVNMQKPKSEYARRIHIYVEGVGTKQYTISPVMNDPTDVVMTAAEAKSIIGAEADKYNFETQSTKPTLDNNLYIYSFTATIKEDPQPTQPTEGGNTPVYEVRFYDVNGNCHWSINVTKGSTVGVADNSTSTQISFAENNVGKKDGYTFAGWQIGGTGSVLTTDQAANVVINGPVDFKPYFQANGTTPGGTTPGSTTTYAVKFYDVNGNCHWSIDVASGSTVDIADNSSSTKVTYAEANVGTKDGYKFAGWQINGTGDIYTTNQAANRAIYSNTSFYPVFTKDGTSTGSTGTNKFPYKVYLHIYLNNKVDEPTKTVNITDGIAVDGVVNKAEVQSVVKQYYTAKNSDGLKLDGLYMAEGNWVGNFAYDMDKYDEITGINDLRQEREVHINVMVTNATAKSTTTSSSTNPKTGDSIGMTVSALGITACALAAAYYVSKKRIAK